MFDNFPPNPSDQTAGQPSPSQSKGEVTISKLLKEYHQCGGYLRRNDASVKKPSHLFDAWDVVQLANKEIKALKERLSALEPSNPERSEDARDGRSAESRC